MIKVYTTKWNEALSQLTCEFIQLIVDRQTKWFKANPQMLIRLPDLPDRNIQQCYSTKGFAQIEVSFQLHVFSVLTKLSGVVNTEKECDDSRVHPHPIIPGEGVDLASIY